MSEYTVTGLNVLQSEIAAWRKGKGFSTPDDITDSVAMISKLMLVVTELAEAAEDVRKGNEVGFKEEIADTFIRLFDITGSYKNFNLEYEIYNKMKINELRPTKHGKVC